MWPSLFRIPHSAFTIQRSKPPMPAHRLLDAAKRSEICTLVAAGDTVADAAHSIGCNPKTIRREAGRDAAFRRELKRAELTARNNPLKLIKQAAATHWRAAAWLLERTDPEHFAKQPPGACRPEQVEDAFARLIEAALEAVYDETTRRRVYQRLAEVAEAETRRLHAAPPSTPRRRDAAPRPYTPFIDDQRLHGHVETAGRFLDATDPLRPEMDQSREGEAPAEPLVPPTAESALPFSRDPGAPAERAASADEESPADSSTDTSFEPLVRALLTKVREKLAARQGAGQHPPDVSPKIDPLARPQSPPINPPPPQPPEPPGQAIAWANNGRVKRRAGPGRIEPC